MRKELKAQIIESISAQIKETPNFYITDISGLNAEQTTKLRRACFEANIKLTVVKNTLFHHVIKELNNEEMNLLVPTLEGNTAIMYTEVANAPAKLIKKFQKDGFEKLSSLKRNSLAISSVFSSLLQRTLSQLFSQLATNLQAS